MKAIPTNKTVLCIKTEEVKRNIGLFYIDKQDNLPIYEVIGIAEDMPDDFRLQVGDKIICNSTGTKIFLEGSEQYLFSSENIAAKIN